MRWLTNIERLSLALLIAVAPVFFYDKTSAADLLSRQIEISDSTVNAIVTNTFSFTLQTAASLGSIEFEYCTNSPQVGDVCTAPAGLSLSSATLTGQTGETGFSIHASSTVNRLILTRIPSPNLSSQPVTYQFSNITNPSTPNETTYVRISTFASNDASGTRTDSGGVAFATTNRLSVQGFVPPYLTFCVGITVSLDCTAAAGDFISLGELSKTSPNYSTSQFAGATNDPGGYSVFLNGTTMSSGTNIINPLGSPQPSSPGSSQFGINLVANSNPGVGQNPAGAGTLAPQGGYSNTNQFKFVNETIASSPLPTNPNILTVSYLVNVPTGQTPGIYAATLTYIATAAF